MVIKKVGDTVANKLLFIIMKKTLSTVSIAGQTSKTATVGRCKHRYETHQNPDSPADSIKSMVTSPTALSDMQLCEELRV